MRRPSAPWGAQRPGVSSSSRARAPGRPRAFAQVRVSRWARSAAPLRAVRPCRVRVRTAMACRRWRRAARAWVSVARCVAGTIRIWVSRSIASSRVRISTGRRPAFGCSLYQTSPRLPTASGLPSVSRTARHVSPTTLPPPTPLGPGVQQRDAGSRPSSPWVRLRRTHGLHTPARPGELGQPQTGRGARVHFSLPVPRTGYSPCIHRRDKGVMFR